MIYAFLSVALLATHDHARYESWVEERRIDLCAEAIIQCQDDRQAEHMADLLIPFRKSYITDPDNVGPVFQRGKPRGSERPYHYKGESIFASDADSRDSYVFVRADQCTVQFTNRGGWFVAVRDRAVEQFRVGLEKFPGEWFRSVLIILYFPRFPQLRPFGGRR